MNQQPSNRASAYSRLAAHVVSTAPDSVTARIQLLQDLLAVLPKKHKRVEMIRSSLRFLQHHQNTQMELPLVLLADLKGGK